MKPRDPALCTLKIYAMLAMMLVLSACTGTGLASAPLTLKIGLVAPFEGLHRPLGYEALFAVKLALQERNAAGGIGGYQVELVALNDFDEPVEAQVQAKALTADPDVLGVVGHLAAEATQAALPVYRAADMAVSIPWTMRYIDGVNGAVSVAATAADTVAQLETLRREQGFNQVELISSNYRGETIPAHTQAIVLATDAVTAGDITLALRKNGVALPLLGQVEVGSPQLTQVAGPAAAGLIFVSPGPAPTDVAATEFGEAYQTLAGFAPGPRAVLAYDATNILLDAMAQAIQTQQRRPTRAEVSAVINTIERHGLSGDIGFDARGQRVNAPVWIYRISEEGWYPGALVAPEE